MGKKRGISRQPDTMTEHESDATWENDNKEEELTKKKPRNQTRKGKKFHNGYRSSYNVETLKAAYDAVMEDGLPVFTAAKRFHVPQSTLRDRVLGKISADVTTSGPPTIFTAEEEAVIAGHVKMMANIGYPLSRMYVRELAGEFAAYLQKREITSGKVLSLKWYYGLLERWPGIQTSQFGNVSHQKLREINYGYSKQLAEILTENNLLNQPKSLYSLDRISVGAEESSLKMVCRKVTDGETIVCNSELAETKKITLLGCGNALGEKLPPHFILPEGKNTISRKVINKFTPGTLVEFSGSGDCSSQVLLNFFTLHFAKHLKITSKSKKKMLVFYDGIQFALPLQVLSWGKQHHVIFFPFPVLQNIALGKDHHYNIPFTLRCLTCVTQSYLIEHQALLDKSPDSPVSNTDICKILCRCYSRVTPEDFKDVFQKSGIYPFCDSAPDYEKIEPFLRGSAKRSNQQRQRRLARKKGVVKTVDERRKKKKLAKTKLKKVMKKKTKKKESRAAEPRDLGDVENNQDRAAYYSSSRQYENVEMEELTESRSKTGGESEDEMDTEVGQKVMRKHLPEEMDAFDEQITPVESPAKNTGIVGVTVLNSESHALAEQFQLVVHELNLDHDGSRQVMMDIPVDVAEEVVIG